nr:TfoX/Sxy family protein [Myxococcus sp. CA051A]
MLEKLGPVQARRMFGGWGLYFGGRMFGLIGDGQLFLKVDDVTRPDFQAAGCRPFIFEGGGKTVALGYWTPPADASDDAYELLPWARRAVDAAARAALKKAPKKKPAAVAKKAPAEKKQAPAKKTPAPSKPKPKSLSTRSTPPKKPAVAKKTARKSPRLKRS